MSTTKRVSMGVVLALVAWGCDGSENRRGSGHSALNGPPLYPNTQRYRNAGIQPATGRSGTASIEVSALLGQNGATDIEVSTAAPGVLVHVQIKIFNAAGGLLRTDNYQVDSSDVIFSYSSLARRQPIQVQAQVRDLDGNRTDVVTNTTVVADRPDLAVTSLSYPPQANTGADVSIGATVAELNGDVGAHCDCVLAVDGAEVDRSVGIWVDAGGVVTCRFIHRFDAAGMHTLRVSAVNVTPADWNLSNNELDGSISIGGEKQIQYQVQAQESSWVFMRHIDAWANGTSTPRDLVVDESQHGWSQSRSFSGSFDGRLSFPIASLDMVDSTDGTIITATHLTNLDAANTWGDDVNGGACAFFNDAAAFGSICSQWFGGFFTQTTMSAFRDGGDVTYHSQGYANYWGWYFDPGMTWNGGYWVWNSTTEMPNGPQVRLGSTYKIDVTVQSGDTWGAHPSFPLAAFTGGWDNPYACRAFMTNGTWCESSSEVTNGLQGWARSP